MRNIALLPIILSFLVMPLKAEKFFNSGHEYVIARRMQIKQEAMASVQKADSSSTAYKMGRPLSITKAVVFSSVIPGIGQFYAKSYIKAAVFFAVEVAAWTIYFSNRKKGDEKDSEFKAYADARWSEYRYWSYVNWVADEYYENYDPFPWETYEADYGGYWYLIDPDYYNANQDEIISVLRDIEGTEFSHRLPDTKTQQYYEMIGKYPGQFGNAWDDANFDSQYSGPSNITAHNDYYMSMRDDSNRFYDIAQYGLMAVLVNHVVSAIEAGFNARRYNRRHFAVEMSYKNMNYKSEYVNMFGLNLIW
jgi:hypothetical protein